MNAFLELSPKQRQVCTLLVRGLTNKEIALKLDMSRRTVEDHRRDAFKRCNVRNAVELTRIAYGIVEETA